MRANASPQTLTVAGRNVLTVKDVLIGEVWLCSGQSNMTCRFGYNKDYYAADIAAANDPVLRCFLVDFHTAPDAGRTNLQIQPLSEMGNGEPRQRGPHVPGGRLLFRAGASAAVRAFCFYRPDSLLVFRHAR